MKAGILFTAALLMSLFCSCAASKDAGVSRPLSFGKPATASTQESNELRPANAVDGDRTTRWSSKFFDPQWIMIDLQKPQHISLVRLVWEKAHGREYEIQISDDAKSWKKIYYTADGRGGIENIPVNATTRYVRYYGTARATVFGHSLQEFELYEH